MRESKLKLIEGKHFYMEEGKFVFTEYYHSQRGYCCGSKCRYCPFEPKYTKGNTIHKKSKKNKGE